MNRDFNALADALREELVRLNVQEPRRELRALNRALRLVQLRLLGAPESILSDARRLLADDALALQREAAAEMAAETLASARR